MGNSASNANKPSTIPNRSQQFPSKGHDSSSPTSPTSPTGHTTHPSLRSKKKSLELPDLASLAHTHNHHQNSLLSPHLPPYSRPPPPISAPIPIPTSPNSNPNGEPRSRPKNNFTSTKALPNVVNQPSTHIPITHHRPPAQQQPIRGAPVQEGSTRSFTSKSSSQPQQRMSEQDTPLFVQETVHSTIPLALPKAEEELARELGTSDAYDLAIEESSRRKSSGDDAKEPTSVKITWHGGGRVVYVARASDNNWKGRHPMQREANTDTWTTTLPLLPGTHHIKFVVDEQWRVATDLPTAVDDEGSLANYVAVPLTTGSTPPTTAPSPQPTPKHSRPGQSFWSNSSSLGNGSVSEPVSGSNRREAQWTSIFPPELIAAAKEEENYLASSSASPQHGVPAPNIPPAPALPRHLDKLILNQRPGASGTSTPSGRSRDRDERRNGRKGRSSLGMTRATSPTLPDARIPVTTASGTDLSRGSRLEVSTGAGLADDASMLPVPSHVVLHHLSTSAIRNGVLAVGNTTRYRKKYLTTIYYKPT